jgi:hypothetical protein
MASSTAIDQLLAFFTVVRDSRRQHPTPLHTLEPLLTMMILATICGVQHWLADHLLGVGQSPGLAAFLSLPPGIPSHDTFGRVFAGLGPARLQQALVTWRQTRTDLSQSLLIISFASYAARGIVFSGSS